jgi:diguanylate cyclase (GGDEF)-like protein
MKTIDQLKSENILPSPKGVALALMEVCRHEEATTQDVARVAQTDPALSGRLIKQANSAAHGTRPVVSVTDAVMHLGINTVRQLALGFSLVDQYQRGVCAAFDYPRFWSHSLLMGLAAQNFGAYTKVGAPDELFACGLMARIGCLALATAYPIEYGELIQGVEQDSVLVQRERQRLEIDHDELSAAMLADWGIPKALAEPVYYHEDPDASGFSPGSRAYVLVHVLYLAKRLADLGVAAEIERSRIVAELMLLGGKLSLDTEQLGERVDQILALWLEWGALLKVSTTSLPAFAKLESASAPQPQVESGTTALRILLVEDDTSTLQLLERQLTTKCGHTVYTATNGREALVLALEVLPQVIITDWLMPEMDGLEFCQALRATEWGHSIYLLMLTGLENQEELIRAYEAGVDEYVIKPVDFRALQARLRAAWRYVRLLEEWEHDRAQLKQFAAELAVVNRKLEHAAFTDPLTSLYNRRAAMDLLDQAWSSATRNNTPLTVIAIDIDYFKTINDQYGHAVGDYALKTVAQALRAVARKEDNVCRIGGEEFLVICQNADLKSSLYSAERLRKTIHDLKIQMDGVQITTTVSLGVAQKETDLLDVDALVKAGDKALYAAKHHGRNRTCLFTKGNIKCGNP